MSSLDVSEVRTRRERLEFIKMPWRLYERDPHWVPPVIADQMEFLDPKRGTFFDHGEARLFLARRAGEPVGRITAHVNELYDRAYGAGTGFFGFFECENRADTARALLGRAESFLRSRRRAVSEGSLSFGIYDEVGILVEGFDTDPYVLNVHNPPYYRDLITGAGYEKAVDWFAYRGRLEDYRKLDGRLLRIKDRVLERSGLELRPVDLSRVSEEARVVKQLFDTAWSANWGHVPFSEREWDRLISQIRRIVIPELTLIAEKDGTPVGFTLTTYDANVAVKKLNGRLFPFGFLRLIRNLKRTRRIRFILMGVLREYRGRGIESALMLSFARRAYERGFEELEMSLVVEDNTPMIRALEHFPVEVSKVYRIFRKNLEA